MKTLSLYHKLASLPWGKSLFSKLVCFKAPYFKSINPLVAELKPNLCIVKMKKRRRVHNHIKTVHAIAICNMAELAAGLVTDVSIPAHMRWIPKAMQVKYLKKATTDLTAMASGQSVDWSQEGDVTVHVDVSDNSNQVVFTADIVMNLKVKPS